MNIIEYWYDEKKSINTQAKKKHKKEREIFNRKIRFSPTRSHKKHRQKNNFFSSVNN